MPPKVEKAVPSGVEESSLTQEKYEKELRELAAKARGQTTFKIVMHNVAVSMQAAQILACAAMYSNLSQLTLAPVYGSIPASAWHVSLVATAACIGWAASSWFQRTLPRKPIQFLGPITLSIPLVQHFLSLLSTYLGPVYGPPLTELLTLIPLVIFAAATVDEILENLDLSSLPKSVAEAAPGLGSFFLFQAVQRYSKSFIVNSFGASVFQSRLGLQLIIGAVYARAGFSVLMLAAVPSLFHSLFLSPHLHMPWTTFDLNKSLDKSVGFKILARQDSNTGYLSVLENTRDQYRVLRCDHSLLGGNWLARDDVTIEEPIYGVFAMLEAVRLIQVDHSLNSEKENALVIGLGIGTTPTALISHGINTTVVEIDPIVRKYALDYFSLPKNHTAVIEDAVKYASRTAKANKQKFDYIVHDVFTGGAEPLDLFTIEFFQDLHTMLKPNGAIAINYAGDLLLPPARLVVRTIKATFPTCRVYRENSNPDASTLDMEGRDFTNMVIFCVKQDSGKPLTFRQPVEADYLGSKARRTFLVPEHEIGEDAFEGEDGEEGGGGVLRRNNTARLANWQRKSAVGHWSVMRTVLPSQVWENW